MSNQFGQANWGGDSSDEYDVNDTTKLIGNQQTSTYQATVNHAEGLEKLGEAVKRQKYVAHSIATEVDIHNEILDEIETGLAATDINLRKNTRNIRLVTRKSSTCCLWVIISALAALIVVLAII